MSVMKSSLSPGTPEFQANQAAYAARIADLHARRAAALAAGPLPAQEKLRQAKQLLARERVAALLDAGSPFLELCQLGGCPQRTAEFLAAGLSETDVRRALLAARTQSPEIGSAIHPDAHAAHRASPEHNPLIKAVKHLTGKE